MKSTIHNNIEINLTSGIFDPEQLKYASLSPRFWLFAKRMGPHEWATVHKIYTTLIEANPSVAPQLFFVTSDVQGLLSRTGIPKLRTLGQPHPCLMEVFRKILERHTDIAPCRPQVDFIASIHPSSVNGNNITKLRLTGFRPGVYISEESDLQTCIPRGTGLILSISGPLTLTAYFQLARLQTSHFVIWRFRAMEERFLTFSREHSLGVDDFGLKRQERQLVSQFL